MNMNLTHFLEQPRRCLYKVGKHGVCSDMWWGSFFKKEFFANLLPAVIAVNATVCYCSASATRFVQRVTGKS